MSKTKRVRSAIESFASNASSRSAPRASGMKKAKVTIIRANTEPPKSEVHVEEIQRRFAQIIGRQADLETAPHAWLLLAIWDEEWLSLTNPNKTLSAANLVGSHSQMLLIFELLVGYGAIDEQASHAGVQALLAVIESRARAIVREHGPDGLNLQLNTSNGDPDNAWTHPENLFSALH